MNSSGVIVPSVFTPYQQQRTSEKTRLATGKISPTDAVKMRHKPHAVLGEIDSTYHNQPKKSA